MQQETKNTLNEYKEEKQIQEKTLQEERKNEEINALKSRIAEIDNKISDTNRNINYYKNDIVECEREIQESTTRIAEFEKELHQLQNTVEGLGDNVPDHMLLRIRDLKQYIENNQRTIENKKWRLENLRGEYKTSRIAQYEEQIKKLELEKEEIMKKLNN